ncbi:nuclear transport factor 2 family protein [Stutzerimonas azotifigens]|uniref:SnoaL-like domain-containing protein n=1 Tax=Stutzerimonas azotifigens TaxID=291995 RepID=A0ABR5Z5J9_9GAMM|nr:nuclear transport factor 2 family protein [Stutzerimonas azotifigens]MBA1275415.1 SnoaL-like domain-containing protein [Stutzerimonas azotifigens]
MTTAAELLQLHFATLVDDHGRWKTLIADDLLWELPFAPTLGHPARLVGREQVLSHVGWFVGAVENFRFYDLIIHPGADLSEASAEVKAEGLIKPTGRIYRQDYVLFVRVENGKLAFIREYFDPVQAAIALEAPIPALAG